MKQRSWTGYGRLAGMVLLALLVAFAPADAAKLKKKKKAPPYRVSANSALLFDRNGWGKYYARNIDKRVMPASTTKVMTALLVLERKNLNDRITISKSAVNVSPSIAGLKPGERYCVRDLLYALLLNSANDAAVALAEAVSGSEKEFVALMNKKARQLGARQTVFANAHGLTTKKPQYTTAYDMFLIFRTALNKQFFREAIKVRSMTIRSIDGREIALKSHNKAFDQKWKKGVYGKTGYTNAALACFIGVVNKGRQELIIAVFGCPGKTRWPDIKYIIEKYGGIDL